MTEWNNDRNSIRRVIVLLLFVHDIKITLIFFQDMLLFTINILGLSKQVVIAPYLSHRLCYITQVSLTYLNARSQQESSHICCVILQYSHICHYTTTYNNLQFLRSSSYTYNIYQNIGQSSRFQGQSARSNYKRSHICHYTTTYNNLQLLYEFSYTYNIYQNKGQSSRFQGQSVRSHYKRSHICHHITTYDNSQLLYEVSYPYNIYQNIVFSFPIDRIYEVQLNHWVLLDHMQNLLFLKNDILHQLIIDVR